MSRRIKIPKRYSCDFKIPPALRFLGEGAGEAVGATRGPAEARSGGRRAGPGRAGSRLYPRAAFLSAGMPVPALFPHPQHSELPGKHCRRRKARTVFSDSQLSGLEKRFEIQRYLSTPERVELATALSLSETQVGPRRGSSWAPLLFPRAPSTSARCGAGALEWGRPLSPLFQASPKILRKSTDTSILRSDFPKHHLLPELGAGRRKCFGDPEDHS